MQEELIKKHFELLLERAIGQTYAGEERAGLGDSFKDCRHCR